MSKRTWLVFAIVQIIGGILASYGTVYSEYSFVRWSWGGGFLLLLPGYVPAMSVAEKFIHVQTAYIFFPVTFSVNALVWIACSASWRKVQRIRSAKRVAR
jgi:hypothetical protein